MRVHDLLAHNKILGSYNDAKSISNGENPFDILFGYNENGKPYQDTFATRYEPTQIYKLQSNISNYTLKKAENIHTNVHKANFNIAGESLASISWDLFNTKLFNFLKNSKPIHGTEYDVAFSNYNTGKSIYVVVDGQRYKEENGKLIDTITPEGKDSIVGTKIFINEDRLASGQTIRRDNNGEKMYNLPTNYTMFRDTKGNEVLLIKAGTDLQTGKKLTSLEALGAFAKQLNSYSIVRINDYNNYFKNLKTANEDDTILQLIDTLRKSMNLKYLNDYLTAKRNDYLEIKNQLKDNLNKDEVIAKYKDYVNGISNKTLANYINTLSYVLYNS
jgi:hypothetical protein